MCITCNHFKIHLFKYTIGTLVFHFWYRGKEAFIQRGPGQAWQYKPATPEAEIRRITTQASPGKVHKTLYEKQLKQKWLEM
jgi:hypothetical protein